MPLPPIRLDPGCWYKFTHWMTNSADPDLIQFTHWMTNSADPDQFWSQLIWIYTVCKGSVYPCSAEQGLRTTTKGKDALFYWSLTIYVSRSTVKVKKLNCQERRLRSVYTCIFNQSLRCFHEQSLHVKRNAESNQRGLTGLIGVATLSHMPFCCCTGYMYLNSWYLSD